MSSVSSFLAHHLFKCVKMSFECPMLGFLCRTQGTCFSSINLRWNSTTHWPSSGKNTFSWPWSMTRAFSVAFSPSQRSVWKVLASLALCQAMRGAFSPCKLNGTPLGRSTHGRPQEQLGGIKWHLCLYWLWPEARNSTDKMLTVYSTQEGPNWLWLELHSHCGQDANG